MFVGGLTTTGDLGVCRHTFYTFTLTRRKEAAGLSFNYLSNLQAKWGLNSIPGWNAQKPLTVALIFLFFSLFFFGWGIFLLLTLHGEIDLRLVWLYWWDPGERGEKIILMTFSVKDSENRRRRTAVVEHDWLHALLSLKEAKGGLFRVCSLFACLSRPHHL